ncbi:acyl-ACP--UDP-N-acetylglucosamine O-acyltransferase [Coraliomargarita akajimensis]|uniref:Acyl-(Acyl-carrier-protein)--UDP-N-acetylglucosa mineO-acyltransferase n=1 Tax=Coraliomargarita akajimensis (strain DSM 45221 / IAM 15411 / JCM 23193 / KCTC 12865 / 04OKA010-24) TaxID=583355 RepID=D5EJN0_CORAD|nr:acyl-ACP--UDP-N-acetylglucosamine O-acyltransferase [Coraliomargarita akajimensis]ADE54629.1 acyl-(acyl-carrier-protein)--UDP-N-acetylglucosa mineO-acyltransferase [Coraliomargarita akajimensis DSM 45221]
MATQIHPTAIIESGAELDDGVIVGAYAYVGPHVKIAKGSEVMHHATVDGATEMGQDNEVHPYAYVGGKTHDKKFKGGIQRLEIGSGNIFREYVTVHCATSEELLTKVGNHNLILSYSHIAHECEVGDHLVMSSHAALGGHVIVGDHVNIGWGAGAHQFCRIGDYAMVGATSKVVQDVPPYMISDGSPATARTINKVGLERAGFSKEEIALARRVFKLFYKDGLNRSQALEALQAGQAVDHPVVQTFLRFTEASQRGLV